MRYNELLKQQFDSRLGVLSYQVKFFPDNPESFTVDFTIVKRKKTARRKEFKNLPDLKPLAVFEKLILDKRGGVLEIYVGDVIEYYKIKDVYVVLYYPAKRDKDYLLLINGQKISIPNPKTIRIIYEYDDKMLRWRLELNKKLIRILNGEIELEYRDAVYPKLIYIDPTLEIK